MATSQKLAAVTIVGVVVDWQAVTSTHIVASSSSLPDLVKHGICTLRDELPFRRLELLPPRQPSHDGSEEGDNSEGDLDPRDHFTAGGADFFEATDQTAVKTTPRAPRRDW